MKRDKIAGGFMSIDSLSLFFKWWQFFPTRVPNLEIADPPLTHQGYYDQILGNK
jgi:hypothetical protein